MFEEIKRERAVLRALRAVARQRVALIVQPGDVPVIECSPPDEEWFEIGVRTCHIRGWVEVLHTSMPTGKVTFKENVPQIPDRNQWKPKTHYRLTEGGWTILRRSHGWVIATFIVSTLSLFAGAASVVIGLLSLPGR